MTESLGCCFAFSGSGCSLTYLFAETGISSRTGSTGCSSGAHLIGLSRRRSAGCWWRAKTLVGCETESCKPSWPTFESFL